MAVSINATVGDANANSYVTLTDANTMVEAMISSADVSKWTTGTTDNRHREGVRKPDTYIQSFSHGFPYRLTEDYYTNTEIPDQVKRAQVELAVYLHNNVEGISLGGLEDFKSVKVGSIEVTPDKSGAVGADRVPPMFERYLTGLRISGPGNIAIRRS
jgi:hypothetical protein